jgi:hypothetical protein
LAADHFKRTHTFRVEWQPGPGGRIDWFSKGYKLNETFVMTGDGKGKDWSHAYQILDEVLNKTMGSQIPIEPSYLIMNTAVSSTWGFPYDVPDSCEKCFDCNDPKCACSFYAGFCEMLRKKNVAMKIDSVRVYQSRDPSAHVGANHTLGCDPPAYPTRGWIKGHSYRYMRNAPFAYEDKGYPLKPKIAKGGGSCKVNSDCGGDLNNVNLTEVFGKSNETEGRRLKKDVAMEKGRGKCVSISDFNGLFFPGVKSTQVCKCNHGYTGPNCLAQDHIDETESAYTNTMKGSLFTHIPDFEVTTFMIVLFVSLFCLLILASYITVKSKRKKYTSVMTDASHGVIWA